MTVKNRYVKGAHISTAKFRDLLRYFAIDLDASQIATVTGLSRNTVNRYLRALRLRLVVFCNARSPFSGEIEVDESFFGPKRVKGKRGRGAYGKTIVFGIFKRNGGVYTEIVPNCSKASLQKVIRGKVGLESIIYSDGWRGYDGLVDVGYGKHLRVDHGKEEFARDQTHINGIERFWGFAKTRLVKFRGMHPQTFYLHLKECEFRFNHRSQDVYSKMIDMLKQKPLKLS